jgi:hypothetical protein
MLKYLIGVVILAIVATAGYYAWEAFGRPTSSPPSPEPELPTTSTYATSTFLIVYSSAYTVDDTYTYDAFEGKPIAGVKFTIPEMLASGTNLSFLDTGVSVEWLPRAQKCTGDIYVVPNVKAIDLTIGSTTYSVATTTGAAAGNMYEEQVYAIKNSQPCTAIRYFIHFGNIGNYPQESEGSVSEFDRAALTREFDTIRNSLILRQ